jgi:tetratricopeptide (TPR) repeat protein
VCDAQIHDGLMNFSASGVLPQGTKNTKRDHMGEKSETESKIVPASPEVATKDEPVATPETQPGRSAPVTGSRHFLFVAAALLVLVIAATSASVALYRSSRSTTDRDQKAAFEEFRQSLQRMEKQIATSGAHRAAGPAADHSSHSPAESSGLLDAANLRYREGQFQEAVASYRAAMETDLAASFNDETHYRYAQSLLKTGNLDGALAEFQTVEAGFPGSPYFASAATETARLLFQKKSFTQARRVLYELIAARDRLSPADKSSIEWASFFVARCYESEAESLDNSLHPSLGPPQSAPVARADNPEHAEGK